MMNGHICIKCAFRQQVCRGPCACTVDGRDILDHAAKGDCPKGHFSEPGRMPAQAIPKTSLPDIPLAGDVVEKIAKAVGADRLAKWWEQMTGKPCGCGERKEVLNAATRRLLKWWEGRGI